MEQVKIVFFYGWNTEAIYVAIINAGAGIVVNNSEDGPWSGDADIGRYMRAGVNYLEYLDGGYENTRPGPIANDLVNNLLFIEKMAAAGAYGIFVDQVSSFPSADKINGYLRPISEKARSLGLKVAFNVGVGVWSDELMNLCDYINSVELWNNEPLTASQQKFANRVWLLTQNVQSAAVAASLTNAALQKGVMGHYACYIYAALPAWFGDYMAQVNIVPTGPEISDMDIHEAYQKFLDGVKFIDIRRPSELMDGGAGGDAAKGFIPDAINIDFYAADFQAQLDALDKNVPYVEYCRTGNRTEQAKAIFKALGFREVYNLIGGITEWKAAGYPVIYAEEPTEPPGGYTTISPEEAFAELAGFAEIMDSRTYDLYGADHLVGAINRTYG